MMQYNPSFKIIAKDTIQAQKINDLLLSILKSTSPDKLEEASTKVKKDPKLLKLLIKHI